MKKRAMKKYISRDNDYCYTIKGVETAENGMTILKCDYCKNHYMGMLINDAIIDGTGKEHPVKRRKKMCRYLNKELFYDDTKECGVGHTKW